MADSSFDPLALVKAMGPQRDPFSWAEQYAADASKGQQLRDEIKNRLLIHESDQKARAKEGAADRENRTTLSREAEAGRQNRFNESVKAGRFGSRAAGNSHVILPPGSMDAQEYNLKAFRDKKFDTSKYSNVVIGGHMYRVPSAGIGGIKVVGKGPPVEIGPPGTAAPGVAAPAAANPDDDWEAGLD